MPKYFFQVSGGSHVLDEEGSELPDASAARVQGIKFAGQILSGLPTLLYETADLKIAVTDENGQVLFKVLVTTVGDSELQPDPDGRRYSAPRAL